MLYDRIMRHNPSEALRMCQNRDKAGVYKARRQVLNSWRKDVMSWLEQKIAALIQCRKLAGRQPFWKIRRNVHIRADKKFERDLGFMKMSLKYSDRATDCLGTVVIDAGDNVRRASHMCNAVGHGD